MFWKNKELTSEEYNKVLKKIGGLEADVFQLAAKYEALNTSYNDLRGKFNRKLYPLKKEEEEKQQDETESNLKTFNPFM